MLVLRVVSFRDGRPPSQDVAEFDETGGTIGRLPNNHLVLAHDHSVSRLHATIAYRHGGYVVIGKGSNPLRLNGRELINDVETRIADGDELCLGETVLKVDESRSVASAGVRSASAPAGIGGSASAGDFQAPPRARGGRAVDDPLRMFAGPESGGGASLFDDLPDRGSVGTGTKQRAGQLAERAGSVFRPERSDLELEPSSPRVTPSRSDIGELIPEDLDVFSTQFGARELSVAARTDEVLGLEPGKLPDDFGLDLGMETLPVGSESIDVLYGLEPGSDVSAGPFGIEHPLGETTRDWNSASTDNPLASLGPTAAPPPPVSDHVPELCGAYAPPVIAPGSAESRTAASTALDDTSQADKPRAPPEAAHGMYLSWESATYVAQERPGPPSDVCLPSDREVPSTPPAGEPRSDAERWFSVLGEKEGGEDSEAEQHAAAVVAPKEASRSAAARRAEFGRQESLPAATSAEAVTRVSAATPAQPASPAVPIESGQGPASDELLQAFLAGLASPGLKLPQGLDLRTMELIGALLRESVQGTLDLLLARAVTKREVKAEVTMMLGSDEINPLKFSPDASIALPYLLAPPSRGFMPAEEAVRDAYDDLRSHTFGFMAGMRAALAGVLARFDPANLEAQLSARSMLDNLLPINRRAKLWDLFAERYKHISEDAEEDFHALFGKAFLRAYEEQVARLKDGRKEQ